MDESQELKGYLEGKCKRYVFINTLFPKFVQVQSFPWIVALLEEGDMECNSDYKPSYIKSQCSATLVSVFLLKKDISSCNISDWKQFCPDSSPLCVQLKHNKSVAGFLPLCAAWDEQQEHNKTGGKVN